MDDTDRAILDLEARVFRWVGTKECAIRALGLTPRAYLVRLNMLLDMPEATVYRPDVVRRLRARRVSSGG